MSLWDPQQREWLQALGHSLLVLAGDEPADSAATLGEDMSLAARARAADGGEQAAAPVRDPVEVAPTARARPDAAPDEPTAPAPASARPRTDPAAKLAALAAARRAGAARNAAGPLGEALLRATGRPPAAAARVLRELEFDQAALRDDPAAKRALWARLRRLRKVAAK